MKKRYICAQNTKNLNHIENEEHFGYWLHRQIGSELTRELRKVYGNDHVVAGYIVGAEPKGELKESGPSAIADVTDAQLIADVVKKYDIDAIYNLAALLSVVAEKKPQLAWKIGIGGLWNILEVARENHFGAIGWAACAVVPFCWQLFHPGSF